jgi:hypothetical protein
MGCLFFWFLFFGQAKKRNSAVGPRPDFKTSVAIATLLSHQTLISSFQRILNRSAIQDAERLFNSGFPRRTWEPWGQIRPYTPCSAIKLSNGIAASPLAMNSR